MLLLSAKAVMTGGQRRDLVVWLILPAYHCKFQEIASVLSLLKRVKIHSKFSRWETMLISDGEVFQAPQQENGCTSEKAIP